MQIGTVFLGTVICSVPAYGIAVVTTDIGTQNVKNVMVAHLPMCDSSMGAMPQELIPDGAAVVCLRHINSTNKAYILCAANHASTDLLESLEGRSYFGLDKLQSEHGKDEVFESVIEKLLPFRKIFITNQAHGVDENAIPGDYDIMDQTGNTGLHIGRFLTQLRGSPLAWIDVSNITNAIRMVANKIERHTLVSLDIDDKGLKASAQAISLAEAFGKKEGPVVEEENDELLVNNDDIPLYRIQSLSGEAADGREDKIVAFPDADEHVNDTEPCILYNKKVVLTGESSEASAQELSFLKSPFVHGMQMFGYNYPTEDNDVLSPFAYFGTDEEPKEKTPEERDKEISDEVINMILDRMFTGNYLERLKMKMAEHGLSVSKVTLGDKIEGEWKKGATTAQQYGLPPAIVLQDPVSGRQVTYFASTSLISQRPDGSIVLCDGYGSEIRMSRGNIYISPALDLFLRPGRDMVSLTPRNLSLDAQQYITISSSKSSVYLKAEGDLKLLGANKGDGMVVLESRATNQSKNSGLMLKSLSNAVFVGNNLYIGRNKGTSISKNRVEDPGPGSIIIDAGLNGWISERSGAFMVDASSLQLVASQGDSGSAIMIGTNAVGMYTEGVQITGSLAVQTKQTAESVEVYRDGNVETITLNPGANPSLLVEGSMKIGGSMQCEEKGIFKDGIAANGVASNSPECGVVDRRFRDPFAKEPMKKSPAAIHIAGNSLADGLKTMSTLLYQDIFVSDNEFKFPEEYGVAELRVPGMLWQNEADGDSWEETYVKSSVNGKNTACYPGQQLWENADISVKGNKTAKLRTSYKTNVKGPLNG